ncbi:hypothetical protein [Nocardiopsis sp. NRRL B-16309]|uniref:hypothetical protein n=1 Tax=Nocardiopsis sp. NRRL B-16309 TaxID=1519494 RepID=UPI0006AD9D4C|nr:hypothetical protein [Nocardiopsis sp. NRRL B-16309]KOX12485.1 hypothetical protein ADL05_21675 [Nocardiopsis sp. NRRL B-16309]
MARLRTLNVDTKSGREDILVLDHLTEEELAGRLDLVTTVRKAVTTPAIIAFPFPVTLPDDDPPPANPPTDNPTRGEVLSGRALAWKTLALRLLEVRHAPSGTWCRWAGRSPPTR